MLSKLDPEWIAELKIGDEVAYFVQDKEIEK